MEKTKKFDHAENVLIGTTASLWLSGPHPLPQVFLEINSAGVASVSDKNLSGSLLSVG